MRTGWTLIGVVVAIGCGRIAFDPLPDDGRDPDATDALVPPSARKLVVGWQHACVLEPTGALYCWGENSNSQHGVVGPDQLMPTRVAPMTVWTDVALGDRHMCALDDRGRAWCWGGNGNSELGISPAACGNFQIDPGEDCDDTNTANGDACTCMCKVGALPPDVVEPALIPDGRPYRRIFASRFTTCAIALDDTLWCWGRNGATQLGLGLPNDDRGIPAQVTIVAPQIGSDTSWAHVAIGDDHVCATQANGSLWCWGSNANQQLGQASSTMVVRERPSVVVPGSMWNVTAAGRNASCALAVNGALSCWGINDTGQLGLGDLVQRDVPTQASPGPYADLAAVAAHACAIRTDSTLHCWGVNTAGQLGLGSTAGPKLTPQQVAGSWRAVGVGSQFSCALDQNDAVWCFGNGANGRLGTGTTSSSTVPVQVAAF